MLAIFQKILLSLGLSLVFLLKKNAFFGLALLGLVSLNASLCGQTRFTLGFDPSTGCGGEITGSPGSEVEFEVLVTLTQENYQSDRGGAQAWQFSICGENLRFLPGTDASVGVTTHGDTRFFPPEGSQRDFPCNGEVVGHGLALAPGTVLNENATFKIFKIRAEATIPLAGSTALARLSLVESASFKIAITENGQSVRLDSGRIALQGCAIRLLASAGQTCLRSERGVGTYPDSRSPECGDYLTFTFTSPDPLKRLTSVVIDASLSALGTTAFETYLCGWSQPAEITSSGGLGTQALTINFANFSPGLVVAMQVDIDRSTTTGGTVFASEFSGAALTATFSDGETIAMAYDLLVDSFTIAADSCPPLQIDWSRIREAIATLFARFGALITNGLKGGAMSKEAAADLSAQVETMEAAARSIDPGGNPQVISLNLKTLEAETESFRSLLGKWEAQNAIKPSLAEQLVAQTQLLDQEIAAARAALLREVCDGRDNDLDGLVDEGFDRDGDGVADCLDNCPGIANSLQTDGDGDGIGTACDRDEKPAERKGFFRGDFNADLTADITDAIGILEWLFIGRGQPSCQKASDLNDDGGVDVSDAIGLLEFLFLGKILPQVAFGVCSSDQTPDGLDCQVAPCTLAAFCGLLEPVPIRFFVNAGNTAGPWNGATPETGFQTIQEAIDASSPGDYVAVLVGVYDENVTLPQGIGLVTCSEGGAPVIDGGPVNGPPAIVAEGDNTIMGFIIQGGSTGIRAEISGALSASTPLDASPETRVRVAWCEIRGTGEGIAVDANSVYASSSTLPRKEALVELEHNYIYNISANAIRLQVSPVAPLGSEELQIGIEVEGNVIHDAGQGISLRAIGAGPLSNFMFCPPGCGQTSFSGFIKNNLIFNAELHGIVLRGEERGYAGITIVNNTIADNGNPSAINVPGHGIFAWSEAEGTARPAVINNIICRNTGAGYLELGGASDAVALSHNFFFGNSLGHYFDDDTSPPAPINSEADLNDPEFSQFFGGSGNQVESATFDPFDATGSFAFFGALYFTGPADYFLNQTPTANPAIDGGNFPAADLELDGATTAASGAPDGGTVDLGFHYPLP